MTLKLAKPTTAKLAFRKTWQPMDSDAAAYIAAVETADGQALEEKTKIAIDNFVLGCKADGIWSAIKASCILAGARTLNGALVPLRGTAPSNFNFVVGDYNRKTGLVGDGTSKYLNSNRSNSADPQGNKHLATFVSNAPTASNYLVYIGASTGTSNGSLLQLGGTGNGTSADLLGIANASTIAIVANQGRTIGFKGISRDSGSFITIRSSSVSSSYSQTSTAPANYNLLLYATSSPGPIAYSDARLAFYSIGEALDLARLDARVTDLINAIGAAF